MDKQLETQKERRFKQTRFKAIAHRGKVVIGLEPSFAATLQTVIRDAMARKNYGNVALDALQIALGVESDKAADQNEAALRQQMLNDN